MLADADTIRELTGYQQPARQAWTNGTFYVSPEGWLYNREHEVGPDLDPHFWLDRRWRELLIGPDMAVSEYGGHWDDVPDMTGIYFLWAADGSLLYVGMTNTPEQRFKAHWKRGLRWVEYGFLEMRYELCKPVESAYIYALRPPVNRMYEQPRWSGHDAMVAAILEMWNADPR